MCILFPNGLRAIMTSKACFENFYVKVFFLLSLKMSEDVIVIIKTSKFHFFGL